MNTRKENNRADANSGERSSNRLEESSSVPHDLPDSKEDSEKLKPEETYIDLPDVKDIPGQEFVNAPPAGVLGDTTISSADEEGARVFDQDEVENFDNTGTESDVGRNERKALEQTDYLPTSDADNLRGAGMDNVDFDNEPLNERAFGEEKSGKDLDIPGSAGSTREEPDLSGDEENK